MWETIKEHKLLIGGIVAVVFVFVLIFGSSSSSSTATATPTTGTATDPTVAANEYLAQLQATTQQAGIAASQAVGTQQIAASVTENTTNAGVTNNANTLAAQVAEFETKIAGDVQTNHDTLTAQTQQKQIQGQTDQLNIVATALTHQSDTQASVSKAYIDSLPALVGAQGATQVAVAQAAHPCSSYLFGLISSC